jgi:hypothetical protein
LDDTWIVCDVISYDNLMFDDDGNYITVDFKWSCKAKLEVSSGSVYTFMGIYGCI